MNEKLQKLASDFKSKNYSKYINVILSVLGYKHVNPSMDKIITNVDTLSNIFSDLIKSIINIAVTKFGGNEIDYGFNEIAIINETLLFLEQSASSNKDFNFAQFNFAKAYIKEFKSVNVFVKALELIEEAFDELELIECSKIIGNIIFQLDDE